MALMKATSLLACMQPAVLAEEEQERSVACMQCLLAGAGRMSSYVMHIIEDTHRIA